MKKKLLILSCFLSIAYSMKSQDGVGINTSNPKGKFHVDGQGNTDNSNITTDDVIVSDDGKMGIGTISPTELLDVNGNALITGNASGNNLILKGKGLIKGKTGLISSPNKAALEIASPSATFQIDDTDFTEKKYLMSDSLGNASWQYQRPDFKIQGFDLTTHKLSPLYDESVRKTVSSTNNAGTGFKNITDYPLTLTKGKWLIICKYVVTSLSGNASGSEMMLWSSLRSKPASAAVSEYTEVARYGNKPEQGGYYVVTPQFSYLAVITEETTLAVFANISTTTLYQTYNGFGNSFFVAIRLDDK